MAHVPRVVADHVDNVAQPDGPAIRRRHAQLEIKVAAFLPSRAAQREDAGAVLLMDQANPEVGLVQPSLGRIAEDLFGPLADKGELAGAGVGFPDDAVEPVDEVAIAALGLFGLGAGGPFPARISARSRSACLRSVMSRATPWIPTGLPWRRSIWLLISRVTRRPSLARTSSS